MTTKLCQNLNVLDGMILFKEMKDFFECPVCYEEPVSRSRHKCLACKLLCPRANSIYQCVNGHLTCRQCFWKSQFCPICREQKRIIKSLPYEQVLNLKNMIVEKGNSFKRLVELFQCIKCGFLPSSKPVMQCREGHIICGLCFPLGHRFCNLFCNRSQKLREFRSLFAEFIISKITRSCRYAKQGCRVVLTDFGNHEELCDFRENDV